MKERVNLFISAFIVKYLEQKSCEYQLEAGWVHQLMIDIGVPALKILELYDRMFKSRVSSVCASPLFCINY